MEVYMQAVLFGIISAIPIFAIVAYLRIEFFESNGLKKSARTSYEPKWFRLDEANLDEKFKRYIAQESQPLLARGYVSAGIYLPSVNLVTRTEAACYLHPQGHDVVEILNVDGTLTFEIISYLDDGSVISSNVIEDVLATIQKLRRVSRKKAEKFLANRPELNTDKTWAEMASHGFLICRYPGSTLEELIEKHQSAVQAVLADPNVGLRKLNPENLREYGLYQTRHFNQIAFELGRKDNAPRPFVFPAGELVENQVGETASRVDFQSGLGLAAISN